MSGAIVASLRRRGAFGSFAKSCDRRNKLVQVADVGTVLVKAILNLEKLHGTSYVTVSLGQKSMYCSRGEPQLGKQVSDVI